MNKHRSSFEAYYSIPKLLLYLSVCSVIIIACFLLVFQGLSDRVAPLSIAGVSGLTFFGSLGVLVIFRLFNRREQIRIDSKGVMVREIWSSIIPHESIEAVGLDKNFLWLCLLQPENYPARSLYRRLFGNLASGLPKGCHYIVDRQYDCSIDEILDALEHFRPKTKHQLEVDRLIAASGSD
ncbi:MAG: hypothetical protein KBT59_01645 [Sphingomonadales bacterium]|nr:hypothetical protein [Sphingomonadales bacterium]